MILLNPKTLAERRRMSAEILDNAITELMDLRDSELEEAESFDPLPLDPETEARMKFAACPNCED